MYTSSFSVFVVSKSVVDRRVYFERAAFGCVAIRKGFTPLDPDYDAIRNAFFGKIKLSCDVTVVDHFSHQVIVFE
jgi:hypothetical protein